jgi:hypothetical protein
MYEPLKWLAASSLTTIYSAAYFLCCFFFYICSNDFPPFSPSFCSQDNKMEMWVVDQNKAEVKRRVVKQC